MNIVLWILQILLALHTAMGAVWKFSHGPVPSLKAIPQGAWLGLGILELLCSVGLLLTVYPPLAILAPIAALCIAAVMLLFCGLHLQQRAPKHGQMVYWLVVAAVCGFIAYGRLTLIP